MILQALYDYYQRKATEPDSHLAPNGFQLQEIKFIIVLDEQGNFIDLQDTRGEDGKGRKYYLPKALKRSGSLSWKTTFLLWDHYGYVLAHPKDDHKKSIELAQLQNQTFYQYLQDLPEEIKKDPGVKAVLRFYERGNIELVKKHPNFVECAKIPGCNLTFKLDGDLKLIPERDAIVHFVNSNLARSSDDMPIGTCLITGEKGLIARLHTATPIIGGRSNSTIVAFQKNSGYDSYGKEQAFNAPISIMAEAAYTTALKSLISSQSNKVIINDSTILFWSIKKANQKGFDLESCFAWYFTDDHDDPDRGIQAVKSLYESFESGQLPKSDDHFYVLSLAPNVARIVIRFFRQGTVSDFGEKIYRHFEDFSIIQPPQEPEYLSLSRILKATAFQNKMENVPPNLADAVMQSILDGTPYPMTLLQQCIRRIRAERNVTRTRAAILKATINRFNRIHRTNEKEISMALDLTNKNQAYLLGRLFAVLEKIQEEAQPGINATIRDRYYGAASATPVTVFPQLIKLKNHHLAKMENLGRRVYLEKLLGEIIADLTEFAPHLSMNQQAYFAIGYYHQRQDFFK